ncbi:hypothetical protein BU25DRAFT_476214 [Macroventuria anomochaeta]|uniref:Uncharacterized protein n=1 Tax=Macroventuria anomochaeta TaxID=301207 RepID=A0ACB6RRI7_9PLEO|nr:uncharacterized protein BU25DRAFT_476214 [Macroventuria anomochaeta]KAF2624511.1 hypothetical protein BU25DRAFT_476214 [Macroventuria anomochaeta]
MQIFGFSTKKSAIAVDVSSQEPYVALSYVWGANQGHGFPQTIKDAIEVTKTLGHQYLWVDRYCIKQESVEKHQRINQIDIVYQAVDVTINAAAGTNANFGLPGASKPCKDKQHGQPVPGLYKRRIYHDFGSCSRLTKSTLSVER